MVEKVLGNIVSSNFFFTIIDDKKLGFHEIWQLAEPTLYIMNVLQYMKDPLWILIILVFSIVRRSSSQPFIAAAWLRLR